MIWSVPAFLAFCPAFYLWYPTLHPTELSSFSLPQNAVSCLTCAVPSAQNSLPSPPLSGLVFKSHVTSFRKPSLTFPSEPEPSLLGSWTTQGHHSCGLFAPHSNWGLFICLSWVHWSQGQCLNLPPPPPLVSLSTKKAWSIYSSASRLGLNSSNDRQFAAPKGDLFHFYIIRKFFLTASWTLPSCNFYPRVLVMCSGTKSLIKGHWSPGAGPWLGLQL